jgi:hypothetical protein
VDVVDGRHGGEALARRPGERVEAQPVALVVGVGLELPMLVDRDAVVEDGLVVGHCRHVHGSCSSGRGRIRP